MSLFVNPSGKIVMASNAKPIECIRCPCQNIPTDPSMYCVTKKFFAPGDCTPGGTPLLTLEHQCTCMETNCTGDWDQISVCDGDVLYVYESGPNVGCPDNCNPPPPANCPTDFCVGCSVSSVSIDITPGGCANMTDTVFGFSQYDCAWNSMGYKTICGEIHPYLVDIGCGTPLADGHWWVLITYEVGGSFQYIRIPGPIGTSCPVGSYTDGTNSAIVS